MVVIDDILKESREYYLRRKRSLVGFLLGVPRGSIRRKVINGGRYCYLHGRDGPRTVDIYIGKEEDRAVELLKKKLAMRSRFIDEVKVARNALKSVGVKKDVIDREDFGPPLKRIFEEFDRLGLWEAGLELVGSWCFKVFQYHLGVEFYPFRTLDIDIAIPASYHGPEVDLGEVLKSIGFEQDFRPNGAMIYHGFGMMIELLSPDKGKGVEGGRIHIEKLKVFSLALRYLDLLLNNRMTFSIHGVGRVTVPSMPAFMIHKLLVAPLRSAAQKDKVEKDYRQVQAVAKRIVRDDALVAESRRILENLHKKWARRIAESVRTMAEYLPPDENPDVVKLVLRVS
jgi:hypothetical protein